MGDSKTSLVDPYGFKRNANFDYNSYEEFMSQYLSILVHRAKRWSNLKQDKKTWTKLPELKRFVRKGIPSEYRPMMWMLMSNCEEMRLKNPDLYNRLISGPHDADVIEAIKNDIPRTFPDNIYFQNMETDPNCKRGSLFNVLIAVSHNNKSIGYCQGMNFISGMLLLIVKDEEKVFWLLDNLIKNILPDYYTIDMSGIKIDCEVLTKLIKFKFPAVHNLFEACGFDWTIVATKWLVCLFADVLPVETVLRIWDCLFLEGDKILFRVCLALVKTHEAQILKCRSFTELMELFKVITADKITLNCHDFIKQMFIQSGNLSKSRLKSMRAEAKRTIL